MLEDDVQEVPGVQALALQAPLHVGDRDEDGVDVARLHLPAQLVHRQHGFPRVRHEAGR